MTCRASRLSSATITFARSISGLSDVQLLSLNHVLMREAPSEGSQVLSQENWNQIIDELIESVRDGSIPVSRGSHDPIARLEAARTETPSSARYYAAQQLIRRAQLAAEAIDRRRLTLSRDLGVSVQALDRRMEDLIVEADSNSSLLASTEFLSAWNVSPDNAQLPTDRRSLYAYSVLEALRSDVQTGLERERVAGEHMDFSLSEGQPGVLRISYSSDSPHIEILVREDDGNEHIESYRASSTLYGFLAATNQTSIHPGGFLDSLRNDPDARYASREEAERNTWRIRCASCGQFARANAHACPSIGSPEAISADIAGIAAPNGTTSRYTTLPFSNTEYLITPGMIVRTPSLRVLRSEGQDQLDLRFETQARVDSFDLSGTMHLEYDDEENAYHIAAPTRIDNRLRCSCPDYQLNQDCSHIDELVDYISSAVNQEISPEIRTAENGIVLSEIAMEHQASEDAIEAAQLGYPELKKSFEENPELFQEMYKEVREARQKFLEEGGEYPVPYIKENALMGLGARDTGRGFGVEIEYAFPTDWDSQDIREASSAIGRELHELGLTRNRAQGGYGASHGWYRDQHAQGWSYESDFSAAGSDGQAGGEIVSPVMFDEPETWENLEQVCTILKRHGAFASKGSGNHIHVGLKDYDHTVANHNRLLNSFARNEDLIYRMSVNPERGKHRGFGYCAPNSLPSTPYARVSSAAAANNSHGVALNLQSVRGRDSDHIEFRTFDSTINPALIQSQIAMSVLMVEGALRGNGRPAPAEGRAPLGERLDLNPRRRVLTGEAWNETTVGARKFIDEFIPQPDVNVKSNPLIKQFISVFAMTKWQTRRSRRLADLPEDS